MGAGRPRAFAYAEKMVRAYSCVVAMVVLAGCGPGAATDDDAEATASSGSSTGSSTTAIDSTSDATSNEPSTMSATGTDTSTSSADEASSESTPPDLPGCPPLSCGGQIWSCTDGEDNDLDGRVDLLDPDCTNVCDDDEESLQVGLPATDDGCKRDCIADGTSGMGDDGCIYDLKCDPENPGALIGCAYVHPQNNCPDEPVPASRMCIAFCTQYVLPGCDCFGCCTFATPDGAVDVYIESSVDCSVDNLAGCLPCTSRIEECGNACTPEACEICIGAGLPDGCDANVCDNGNPCASQDDCACGEVCQLGCCMPLPPG
jgi:hypothetical protein